MKKIFLLFFVSVLIVGFGFAQENNSLEGMNKQKQEEKAYREGFSEVLIDFTQIAPEYDEPTEEDYSDIFALQLPEEETNKLKTTYALNNWKVIPQNSATFPDILEKSSTKGAEVTSGQYEGVTVLGIRVSFPDYPFEMVSEVQPPFIPDIINPKFLGKGVIHNVGIVRSAYLTAYGLNQPERLYLVTEDTEGNEYEYSFGNLKFIGWKELEWTNPNYIEDVKAREIRSLPLYPHMSSNRRIKSIKIRRAKVDNKTTDVVTYIKDIKMTFDKAIDEDLLTDIDNEAVWNITKERLGIRDAVLFKRSMVQRYLEYLEKRKKYDYANDQQNDGTDGQQNTDDQQNDQQNPVQ